MKPRIYRMLIRGRYVWATNYPPEGATQHEIYHWRLAGSWCIYRNVLEYRHG